MSDTIYTEANGPEAKVLMPDGGTKINLFPHLELLFKVRGDEIDGSFDYFEIKVGYLEGPPVHTHPHQFETFHVLEGELTIKLGDDLVTAREGDFVMVPKGMVHTYANLKKGTTARAV